MAKTNHGEGSITSTMRNGKKYYTGRILLYTDENGKQVRKSFSSYKKSEVVRKLKEAQRIKEEKGQKGYESTFGDMFYYWLFEVKKPVLKPRTLEKYESQYRLKVKNFKLNNVVLAELSSLDIQEHFNYILETGVITIKGAKDLLILLKSYCKYLYTKDYITKNYCSDIVIPKKEMTGSEEIAYFTKEEQIILQNNLDLEKDVDIMILLILSSGLRSGEARGLKWENITGNIINIDHQVQFVTRVQQDGTRGSKEEITELKSQSAYRKIPIPESVANILKKHKIKQMENKLLLGQEYQDNGFVFKKGDGKLLGKRMLGRRLEKLVRKLNLTEVTPHGLRHTYCTRLIEAGVPIKTIQKLMGHADIQTTLNFYAHVTGERKDEAVKSIEYLFNIST